MYHLYIYYRAYYSTSFISDTLLGGKECTVVELLILGNPNNAFLDQFLCRDLTQNKIKYAVNGILLEVTFQVSLYVVCYSQ